MAKAKRILSFREKRQRGCAYCKNVGKIRDGKAMRYGCPFDECPYHILDKHKTYEDFMASEDSKILVNEFFSSVATAYEMASFHKPNRICSDGSQRKDW